MKMFNTDLFQFNTAAGVHFTQSPNSYDNNSNHTTSPICQRQLIIIASVTSAKEVM